jgi:hypothetical protein
MNPVHTTASNFFKINFKILYSKGLHHQHSVCICCLSRPSCGEITGVWRKLHNEELHNLYSSPSNDEVKEQEMGRACSTHAEKRNAWKSLVGGQEEKRPLGKHRRKWEGDIKMDLREIGRSGMDWIDLAQDR